MTNLRAREGEANSADQRSRPEEVLGTRLHEHRRRVADLETRELIVSYFRLAVFACGAISAWLAFVSNRISGSWFLLPVAAFVALVIWHERLVRQRLMTRRRAEYCRDRLRCISRESLTDSDPGTRFSSEDHPYATDLDLFGRGSLFRLLSAARTAAGESRLAGWMRSAAPAEVIRARHEVLAELRDRLELREDLSVIAETVVRGVDFDSLAVQPLEARGRLRPWHISLAWFLAFSNVVTLVLWLGVDLGPFPFTMAVVATIAFSAIVRPRTTAILTGIEHRADDLALFSRLVERVEREDFATTATVALVSRLTRDGIRASNSIQALGRLVSLLDSTRNQIFAPVAAMLLWNTQIAWRVQVWRDRFGSAVEEWVDAYAEIEACCSIAGFSFEHPDYVLPEIIDEGPLFEGHAIGHPLIHPDKLVRNDVTLDRNGTRILVVSGSNMSGKSTLLRTVGVNSVLALMGAPVCASSLRISRLSLGASIHVRDSLQDGRSRFYAEISRLRQIIGVADAGTPLLFLIDEILHGTNSHDRRIGASAILLGLFGRGAIGLVTTHDLAIADVVSSIGPGARNVHFEDHLDGESMVFDYRLKEGVVTKSNALDLMRRVGLDV